MFLKRPPGPMSEGNACVATSFIDWDTSHVTWDNRSKTDYGMGPWGRLIIKTPSYQYRESAAAVPGKTAFIRKRDPGLPCTVTELFTCGVCVSRCLSYFKRNASILLCCKYFDTSPSWKLWTDYFDISLIYNISTKVLWYFSDINTSGKVL